MYFSKPFETKQIKRNFAFCSLKRLILFFLSFLSRYDMKKRKSLYIYIKEDK